MVDGVTYALIKENSLDSTLTSQGTCVAAPKSLLTTPSGSMDVELIPVGDNVALQVMAVETKSNEKDKDIKKENIVESSMKSQLVQHAVLVQDPNTQIPAALIPTGERVSTDKPTEFVTTSGNINLSMNSTYVTADDKSAGGTPVDCVSIQIGDKTYSSKIGNKTPVIEEALMKEAYIQLGHNVLKEGDNIDIDKATLQTSNEGTQFFVIDLSETEVQNSIPMEIETEQIIKAESIGECKNDNDPENDGINKVPTDSSPYYVIQQVTESSADDNQEKEFLPMKQLPVELKGLMPLASHIKNEEGTTIVSLPKNQQNIDKTIDSMAKNTDDELLITNIQGGAEVIMVDIGSTASVDTETTKPLNSVEQSAFVCVSDKQKETAQQIEKSLISAADLISITTSPNESTTTTTSSSITANLQNASKFRDAGQQTEKIKSDQQQTAGTVTMAAIQQSQPQISQAITQPKQIQSQSQVKQIAVQAKSPQDQQVKVLSQSEQLQENNQPSQPIKQTSIPSKSSVKSAPPQTQTQQASSSKQSQPSQLQKDQAKTVMTTSTTTAAGTTTSTATPITSNTITSMQDKESAAESQSEVEDQESADQSASKNLKEQPQEVVTPRKRGRPPKSTPSAPQTPKNAENQIETPKSVGRSLRVRSKETSGDESESTANKDSKLSKKRASNKDADISEENVDSANESKTESVKRKRGRPRKVEKTEIPTPKRGRPRKDSSIEKVSEIDSPDAKSRRQKSSNEDDDEDDEGRRRSGRIKRGQEDKTPKKSSPETPTKKKDKVSSKTKDQESPTVSKKTDETPPRRGRPPRNKETPKTQKKDSSDNEVSEKSTRKGKQAPEKEGEPVASTSGINVQKKVRHPQKMRKRCYLKKVMKVGLN